MQSEDSIEINLGEIFKIRDRFSNRKVVIVADVNFSFKINTRERCIEDFTSIFSLRTCKSPISIVYYSENED